MGRIYTISYAGTLTNAGGNADLLELLPADDKPTKLLGWIIGAYSDAGDAAAEQVNVTVLRLPATVTTGNGTAVTPASLDATNNVAYGGTAECNGATVATTSGSAVTLMELAWTIQASPWEFWFPEPKLVPVVRQGEGLIVRHSSTVADDVSVALTFFIEEE